MEQTDRKAARLAAMEAAVKAVAACDEAKVGENDEDIDLGVIARGEAVDALRLVVTAFGPKPKASAAPRAKLEKAEPATVRAFFETTGLTRKDLAVAAGVSPSVIATVQNEKGDRWSLETFAAKQAKIAAWVESHKDELAARVVAAQAEADAKAAAAAAKAAKQATPAPAPKAAAKAQPAKAATAKAGRPSPARRAANRKAEATEAAVSA